MLSEISILIKTFDRYNCLDTLLASLVAHNLPCPVLIADDSQENYKEAIVSKYGRLVEKYLLLPFDSGLSRGRNVLLENVSTKYFLLCDDDFIFDHRADLPFMLRNLEEGNLDILGGLYYNRPLLIANQDHALLKSLLRGKVRTAGRILLWYIYRNPTLQRGPFKKLLEAERHWTFYGGIEVKERILYVRRLPDSEYTPPYVLCDFVPNFFIARTETLRQKNLRWNDEIKYYGEHLDFFLHAKEKGLRVAMSKEVGVVHQPIHTTLYRRGRNDHKILLRANNLKRVITVKDNDQTAGAG